MRLQTKLQISLSKRPGNVVLRRELAGLGSKSQLSEAIKGLIDKGRLVRLGAGVYAKSTPAEKGRPFLAATPDVLAMEVFNKLGVDARIVNVASNGGRDTYVMDTGPQRVSRKLQLGPASVGYVGHQHGRIAPNAALPEDVNKLPTDDVRAFVEHYASAHGVQYRRTGLDTWAEAVTRASGDDVRLDSTGELLVALKKQKLLNDRQFSRLLTNHTREVKRVRSVRGP